MTLVSECEKAGADKEQFCLSTQAKTYLGDFEGELLIETTTKVQKQPDADSLYVMTADQINSESDLVRKPFECIANKAADHKLRMTFLSVDTEELKDL
jgi:hypothetical protein